MAKRDEKKVGTTGKQPKRSRTGVAVRLDLTPRDAERLERCARAKGLSRASYARMATLERIKSDENEGLPRA